MKYGELFHNIHFVTFAALLQKCWRIEWRKAHPEVPFWILMDDLATDVFRDMAIDKKVVAQDFSSILLVCAEADSEFRYIEEDMRWFLETLDRPAGEAKAILSLLLATASAPDIYLTPTELALMTGTAESGWRNKAAAGEIPGAIKKGKQWLLPRAVLQALDIIQ